jgi:uncharacterized protein YecE (DUF72 family)
MFVGCSQWFYWQLAIEKFVLSRRNSTRRWFDHYQSVFDTVELNAPFTDGRSRAGCV